MSQQSGIQVWGRRKVIPGEEPSILLILKKGQGHLRREYKERSGEVTPLGPLAGKGGTGKKVP